MEPNTNGTQQKRHPLMSFTNNDTIPKWHMTNTSSETDKHGTQKLILQKWYTLQKMHKCYLSIAKWFLKGNS